MISFPLAFYAVKASIRDKMVLAMLLALAITCSLSIFMGSNAVTEKDYFSIVFAASGIRMASVFGLIIFVIFFVRRSFDAKDIEFLLSRPISRVQLIVSYAIAFILLAFLIGAAQTLSLYFLADQNFSHGMLYWGISMILENIVMVSVAFFFSMILSSAATAAMACLGLYALARMMGQILGTLDAGVATALPMSEAISGIMQAVSVVIPRLDLMAQSSWLIYGADSVDNLHLILIQSSIFVLLILVASALDLVRRQF